MDFFVYSEKPPQKEEVMKTTKFLVTCENEQQMNLWASACRENVTFTHVPDFNPTLDFKKPKIHKPTKIKKKY